VKRRFPKHLREKQIQKVKLEESFEAYMMKSLLTIVADSADVEVWFIEKASFS